MPIPLRADFDAPRLRTIARGTKDAAQTRRLLALAAVYDGARRTAAVEVLLSVPWDAACLRGYMIKNKLKHLDPVAHLTASHADRVCQFFVRDWCFGR